MNCKVLITTSGTGARLRELTKNTNKALIRIGKKPAISYIIEAYPKDTNFVVTLGYKGEQVKDFLELVYPEKEFTFVLIDKYEGAGASLGYSMLQTKINLQEPFIYHACDTIIEGLLVPSLKENWVIGASVKNFDQYTSFHISEDNLVTGFSKKKEGRLGDLAHVGLVGVRDYERYWRTLERLYRENPNNSSLNDTITLSEMIKEGVCIRGITSKIWLDIGNQESLNEARAKISDRFDNLDKVDESLFFFDSFVIKFFSNSEKVTNRVRRGEILGNLVPKTLEIRTNFYKYEYVNGDKYSEVVTPRDLGRFITWAQKNLWKPETEIRQADFKEVCKCFYELKTKERIEKFLEKNNLEDKSAIINNVSIPPIRDILTKIDFDWLSDGLQTGFHGDFILENILKTKKGYILLDWRQDFGGLLRGGDMYYDLAKFYHNLVVNHDLVSKNKFTINTNKDRIICKIERKNNLLESEKEFEKIIRANNLDMKKIEVLRALIWLNMSPLHHHPFGIFLFYFGKYHLWQALKK